MSSVLAFIDRLVSISAGMYMKHQVANLLTVFL